jgi:hypothetical protein
MTAGLDGYRRNVSARVWRAASAAVYRKRPVLQLHADRILTMRGRAAGLSGSSAIPSADCFPSGGWAGPPGD